MEGRKLLDAHVFNGRQEIAKPIVTNTWLFWIYLESKSILFNKLLSQKRQSIKKEETSAMKEERELFFVCYILDIHWMALFIELT